MHTDRLHDTNLREVGKEAATIIVGEEDRAPIDAAQNDMHRNPGGAEAGSSRHEVGLAVDRLVAQSYQKTWSVPVSPQAY